MKYLHSIVGTMRADVVTLFRYKKSLISDIITFLAVYFGIVILGTTSDLSSFYHVNVNDGPVLILIGYIFWTFSNIALGYSSSVIIGDAKSGELEVKLQGIVPYSILSFFTVLVTILESLIVLFTVFFISILLGYVQLSSISYLILSVLLTIPSIIGMYGIGLILGGLSLKEKSVGQFVSIISAILLFCSNTLFAGLPKYIYIIPFTAGIDICRKLYSTNNFDVKIFFIYILVCLLWLLIGLVVFNKFLQKEREKGNFDSF